MKWESGGETGTSAENFTAYLNTLFRYISVDTLKKDLTLIEDPDATPIQVGDIFIGEDANGTAVCDGQAYQVADGVRRPGPAGPRDGKRRR